MAVSDNAEPFLRAAWAQALEHAGLEDDDFYLLACPGAVVDGYAKAASYEPGVQEEPDDLLSGAVLEEANDPSVRRLHRIAVFEDVEHDDPIKMAILTATLRHEIEHGRQRMICGGVLFAVDVYANNALEMKAGGLPGSALLYNSKPIEQDANAAAAMLLRERFEQEIVEAVLSSNDAALARSHTPPGDPRSLFARTVCFIFLFADVVERESRAANDISFDRRLDVVSREAGELWRTLVAFDDGPSRGPGRR